MTASRAAANIFSLLPYKRDYYGWGEGLISFASIFGYCRDVDALVILLGNYIIYIRREVDMHNLKKKLATLSIYMPLQSHPVFHLIVDW